MPARSKSQQRLFGMVHAIQKGTLNPDSMSPELRRMAESIDPESVLHFAGTSHSKLPEKKKKRRIAEKDAEDMVNRVLDNLLQDEDSMREHNPMEIERIRRKLNTKGFDLSGRDMRQFTKANPVKRIARSLAEEIVDDVSPGTRLSFVSSTPETSSESAAIRKSVTARRKRRQRIINLLNGVPNV